MKRLKTLEEKSTGQSSVERSRQSDNMSNLQFAVSEGLKPLARVPLKPVKLSNAVTGADKYV